MRYAFVLFIILYALWYGLSGYNKPLLLGLGLISTILACVLAWRFRLFDREGVPYLTIPRLLLYLPWLFREIVTSNIRVIRACLRVDLDIDPVLVKVKTSCQSDLSKTLFANSITLTPGTVTIDVDRDELLVHALYASVAKPEDFIEMDRRCKRAIDG